MSREDLLDLLEEVKDTINGLADQQAMPDEFYLGTLSKIDDAIKAYWEGDWYV